MDKLERMQELFDEVIINDKELRHKLLLRGLSEDDRRTFDEIRRNRVKYIQDKQK